MRATVAGRYLLASPRTATVALSYPPKDYPR